MGREIINESNHWWKDFSSIMTARREGLHCLFSVTKILPLAVESTEQGILLLPGNPPSWFWKDKLKGDGMGPVSSPELFGYRGNLWHNGLGGTSPCVSGTHGICSAWGWTAPGRWLEQVSHGRGVEHQLHFGLAVAVLGLHTALVLLMSLKSKYRSFCTLKDFLWGILNSDSSKLESTLVYMWSPAD